MAAVSAGLFMLVIVIRDQQVFSAGLCRGDIGGGPSTCPATLKRIIKMYIDAAGPCLFSRPWAIRRGCLGGEVQSRYGVAHLDRILDTHPWETRSWREMSHGRTPLCASSTMR